KTHFVIVDAVGVCESDKTDSRPLDRQPTAKLPQLLLGVALGKRDEDALTTLDARLARLDRAVTPEQRRELSAVTGGPTLSELSAALLRALDQDVIEAMAKALARPSGSPADAWSPEPTSEEIGAARKGLVGQACVPFEN